MSYRSPLARLLPQTMDTEQVKRDGWLEHGILVVPIDDDRLDFIDREWITRIGESLYGKRKGE